MKRAALGVRMHSGWGVLVAVSLDGHSVEALDRRRIVTIDPTIPGSKQPYHHAASLALPEAERYLADCAAVSDRLAFAEVETTVRELGVRHCRIVGCAILLAAGRPLPSLAKVLVSHPLLHAAEGDFFRHAVARANEGLKIPVTAIRERDLDDAAKTSFGSAASQVQRSISNLGSAVGPPWTKDHKAAALGAALILAP